MHQFPVGEYHDAIDKSNFKRAKSRDAFGIATTIDDGSTQ